MSITTFPTLGLTIIGVFAALILLGSYYIFVIKCCLNLHRSERSTRSRRHLHRTHDHPLPVHEPNESHGLDELTIKSIPTVAYRKPKESGVFHVCAVCINEFQEEEKIRVLPNCLHFFHVDCIDVWLRANANCPLCRSPITTNPSTIAVNQEMNHVLPEINTEVAINVREDDVDTTSNSTPRDGGKRNSGKLSFRGDESIEMRREKQLTVVPIRRSFSVDSSADRWLSKEVQKILQQNPHFLATPIAGSSATVPKLTLPMDLHWILHDTSS
ncbi:RING-H2 finger protein ATL1 [Rhynchospora pubera]|uniref:RING-type E3 ubiquitin transferase n=1 Tax=Rhynchospora pubera TaxID=906938 RepID=A0AAV8EDK8_9POAL|nr:RING-H2 finger protein ATL1 [Rhynchospora pubera]